MKCRLMIVVAALVGVFGLVGCKDKKSKSQTPQSGAFGYITVTPVNGTVQQFALGQPVSIALNIQSNGRLTETGIVEGPVGMTLSGSNTIYPQISWMTPTAGQHRVRVLVRDMQACSQATGGGYCSISNGDARQIVAQSYDTISQYITVNVGNTYNSGGIGQPQGILATLIPMVTQFLTNNQGLGLPIFNNSQLGGIFGQVGNGPLSNLLNMFQSGGSTNAIATVLQSIFNQYGTGFNNGFGVAGFNLSVEEEATQDSALPANP